MKMEEVIESLRSQGKRITNVRRSVIYLVLSASEPLSAVQILKKLANINIVVNKTTVYRELAFLLSEGIIAEVVLQPGILHFEGADMPHHHHLTCNSCGKVEDVAPKELEDSLKRLVKRVMKQGFVVEEHLLEFYGTCRVCQN